MEEEFAQLVWDENDFVGFFEVLPIVDEYETEHTFDVSRNGIRLVVQVWQLERVARLALYQGDQEEALIDFYLFVRGALNISTQDSRPVLEINNCIVSPSRFSYFDMGDMLDEEKFPIGQIVYVALNERISISLKEYVGTI
ncbi:hypothetical protein [Teredinibacter turnerae]|uniref:hypothetical protein n=1 Tax=Teredinibacter turnerae TaxID=2426 RepID=UPI000364116F|nr:hypothetical protein [Teredinibacter turnerae]